MSIKKLYIPKNTATRFKPGSHPTTERPNDAVELSQYVKDTLGITPEGDSTKVLNEVGNWVDNGSDGGGASPAGPKNAIQFNNNGSFGGSSGFKIISPDTLPTLNVYNPADKRGQIITGNVQIYTPDGTNGVSINVQNGGVSPVLFNIPANNGTNGASLITDGSGNLSWETQSNVLTNLPEFASIAAAQGAGYSGKYVTLTGVTVGILTLDLVVKVP